MYGSKQTNIRDHEGACKGLLTMYGSKQTNIRDFEKARKGARDEIMEASRHDHEWACKGLSLN